MKKIFHLLCAVAVLVMVTSAAPLQAQTITTIDTVVDYQLPYPGMLPDNPFYFLKELRNNVERLFAKGAVAKSEVDLQISDKNISAAVELTKKGKHKLAGERVQKAHDGMSKLYETVSSPPKSAKKEDITKLISTLQKANLKHREVIETLMKDAPTGQVETLEKLRQDNITLQTKLDKLQ